jgi:hypothetical protein
VPDYKKKAEFLNKMELALPRPEVPLFKVNP